MNGGKERRYPRALQVLELPLLDLPEPVVTERTDECILCQTILKGLRLKGANAAPQLVGLPRARRLGVPGDKERAGNIDTHQQSVSGQRIRGCLQFAVGELGGYRLLGREGTKEGVEAVEAVLWEADLLDLLSGGLGQLRRGERHGERALAGGNGGEQMALNAEKGVASDELRESQINLGGTLHLPDSDSSGHLHSPARSFTLQ